MCRVEVYTNCNVPKDLLDRQNKGLTYDIKEVKHDTIMGFRTPVFVVYGIPLDEKRFRMWLKEV